MERMKRVKPETTCKTPNAKTKTDLNVLKHKLRKPRFFFFFHHHPETGYRYWIMLGKAEKAILS